MPSQAGFDHQWNWTKLLPERFGSPCRVLVRGALNNVLVEFEDGLRVVTSKHAALEASGRKFRGVIPQRACFDLARGGSAYLARPQRSTGQGKGGGEN